MLLLRLAVGSLLLAALGARADVESETAPAYVVVVHEDNPTRTIERDQLSKIFLKRVSKWPNGKIVEPVDLAPAAAARATFTEEVHRRSVAAVRAFWQQQIFSGRDVPPPEKASDADVTAFVKDHAGAVGYVSAGAALPAGVKSLRVQGVSQ